MRVYQSHLDEFAALRASLIAISPQTPDASLTTAEKNALAFDVLSDRGNGVARQYGLAFAWTPRLQQRYRDFLPKYNGVDGLELPMPGTFVIARDGRVRLAHVDADYRRRLEPTAILGALRQIKV
ncbi:MAG: AhpC/TSA family protein [Chloroflexi bacterium]|nr:AhpC/TSA family protein [Chloroflexota bacterium]